MSEHTGNMVRLWGLTTCKANVVRIFGWQVPIVLRVEHVKELSSLCSDHHFSLIGMARVNGVDHLMFGTVRHWFVPNETKKWLAMILRNMREIKLTIRGWTIWATIILGPSIERQSSSWCCHFLSPRWEFHHVRVSLSHFPGSFYRSFWLSLL